MSQFLQLALAQCGPPRDAGQLPAALERLCAQAARQGAELLLLPELWPIAYDSARMTAAHAWDDSHPVLAQLPRLARRHGLALGFTYLAVCDGRLRNRLRLHGADGGIAFDYDKVHICNFTGGTETALQPGGCFPCADLLLRGQTVRVGAMICFDREFPEAARTLMKQGAELILVPNACPMLSDAELGDARLQQLRGRALENRCAIALCNYPAPLHDGGSCLIDAAGRIQAQADEREQLLPARLDLTGLRRWRREQDEVWGLAALRPQCY
ncbi:carbon-nitrogen hydrolase family protein [Chromobacterium sphagni]|uniref:CN hydrolase domain-containing protein n=1 Tax=Chromobacterium sphagni TaxID=1903179 RepID=A0A1S1X410_9NEIS|nr:carbon-nitrogen hydrolase family protein [Chromobacterium sphagni]OHX14213.1 hypothetical protein BI347_12400 [Chromobacterium sphagni]OHX20459.1 hypothetical protein BI344_08315 [Chromobacterium sphagni]